MIDYEAIKSLGVIAKGLTKGGLTIPGNVKINGNLTVTKNSNTESLSSDSIKTKSLSSGSITGDYLNIKGASDFCTSSGRKNKIRRQYLFQ